MSWTVRCDECGAILDGFAARSEIDALAIRSFWTVTDSHHVCPVCYVRKHGQHPTPLGPAFEVKGVDTGASDFTPSRKKR